MTDKEKRDKLCKWMSEAGEIAEILRESVQVKQGLTDDDEYNTKGIRSALAMLEFLPVLVDDPANYRGGAFPELAFGLMFLGVAVGEMKQDEVDCSDRAYESKKNKEKKDDEC